MAFRKCARKKKPKIFVKFVEKIRVRTCRIGVRTSKIGLRAIHFRVRTLQIGVHGGAAPCTLGDRRWGNSRSLPRWPLDGLYLVVLEDFWAPGAPEAFGAPARSGYSIRPAMAGAGVRDLALCGKRYQVTGLGPPGRAASGYWTWPSAAGEGGAGPGFLPAPALAPVPALCPEQSI